MVELVDTHVSGACVARHEGSSPSFGTSGTTFSRFPFFLPRLSPFAFRHAVQLFDAPKQDGKKQDQGCKYEYHRFAFKRDLKFAKSGKCFRA